MAKNRASVKAEAKAAAEASLAQPEADTTHEESEDSFAAEDVPVEPQAPVEPAEPQTPAVEPVEPALSVVEPSAPVEDALPAEPAAPIDHNTLQIGPVAGKKGDIFTIAIAPMVDFTTCAIDATDTGVVPGRGTAVRSILIMGRDQKLARVDLPTGFYGKEAAGGRTYFETCPAGQDISFLIRFYEDCEWSATLKNTAPAES